MRSDWLLIAGLGLIVAGLVGLSVLRPALEVRAQEDETLAGRAAELHEQMHRMMDAMMGQGFSQAMHEAMPGSEEMMDACARTMAAYDQSGQHEDMSRMMSGMGGTMRGDMVGGMHDPMGRGH
jgi:hypothetical protein